MPAEMDADRCDTVASPESETLCKLDDALFPEHILLLIFEYADDVSDEEMEDALFPAHIMCIISDYVDDAPSEEEIEDGMKDYSNAVIYQIKPRDATKKDLYLGSATDYGARESRHRYVSLHPTNASPTLYANRFIHANGGWDAWSMSVLESYPCRSRKELERREGYWIKILQPNLNKRIPGRTSREYYVDNRDQRLLKVKAYSLAHKEEIAQKNKIYHKVHYADTIDYQHARQQTYRENNKEVMAQKRKTKRELGLCAKIDQKRREARAADVQITCACGRIVMRYKLTEHCKLPIHKKLMAALALEANSQLVPVQEE